MDYSPFCAVAFLDVLGWRTLVQRSVDDDHLRENMAVALRMAGNSIQYLAGTPPFRSGMPLISQFSDSIVISMDLSAGNIAGFDGLLFVLDRINKFMLVNGLFVRGGIWCGELIHEATVVFGPALTIAYDLESRFAVNQRILVGLDKSGELCLPIPDDYYGGGKPNYPGLLRKDRDGQWFMDVLSLTADDRGILGQRADEEQRALLERVRPHVESNLVQFRGEWRVLGKYIWFAQYFNEVAREHGAREIILPDCRDVEREFLKREVERTMLEAERLKRRLSD